MTSGTLLRGPTQPRPLLDADCVALSTMRHRHPSGHREVRAVADHLRSGLVANSVRRRGRRRAGSSPGWRGRGDRRQFARRGPGRSRPKQTGGAGRVDALQVDARHLARSFPPPADAVGADQFWAEATSEPVNTRTSHMPRRFSRIVRHARDGTPMVSHIHRATTFPHCQRQHNRQPARAARITRYAGRISLGRSPTAGSQTCLRRSCGSWNHGLSRSEDNSAVGVDKTVRSN